ncbi:hypothetical protein A1D17_19455 [Pseudomonas fluorescens]|uniref:Uncharacterized protein n=1 Tax=Pseudomonas fluorescens TaxID=294 RepID=A0A166P1K8_PSEFL|nr:hypothetical protein A1D17_19455 [Pseudomonas fluorescens]
MKQLVMLPKAAFAVGASLAREASTAVYLMHRVFVLRGQASLLQIALRLAVATGFTDDVHPGNFN